MDAINDEDRKNRLQILEEKVLLERSITSAIERLSTQHGQQSHGTFHLYVYIILVYSINF